VFFFGGKHVKMLIKDRILSAQLGFIVV